jgi:transglutaminase-like putative cysteine protease
MLLRVSCVVGLLLPPLATAKEPAKEGKSRTFRLTYAGTVTGLEPGKFVSVWLPVPQSSEDQEVTVVKRFPESMKETQEPRYGNKMFSFEAKAWEDGTVPYEVVYRVTRREVRGPTDTKASEPDRIARFLQPDDLVPVGGKPLELVKGKKLPDDPTEKAKTFYEVVNNHMKYGKPEGKPWGRGDAEWACDSRTGNCTDFHSVFISLARSHKIPAKFEIGFSIPQMRGKGEVPGYHCWAKFRPSDKGWVPVDISEANKEPKLKDYYFGNLTEDRVAFTTGRDIDLVPKQTGKPLNFFVFPYAEVNGEPVNQSKIKKTNSYEDVQ